MGSFNWNWNYPEFLKDLISLKRLSAIASMRTTHALSVSNRSCFLNEELDRSLCCKYSTSCCHLLTVQHSQKLITAFGQTYYCQPVGFSSQYQQFLAKTSMFLWISGFVIVELQNSTAALFSIGSVTLLSLKSSRICLEEQPNMLVLLQSVFKSWMDHLITLCKLKMHSVVMNFHATPKVEGTRKRKSHS